MRISDWSSDVCSSDLQPAVERADEQLVAPDRDAAVDDVAAGADRALAGDLRIEGPQLLAGRGVPRVDLRPGVADIPHPDDDHRPAERRVGEEWVSTSRFAWSTYP